MRYHMTDMPTISNSYRTLFLLGLVLAAVAALAVRVTPQRVPSPSEGRVATSSVPDLTSSAFSEGDALVGLGADWTYISQTSFYGKSAAAINGISPFRQSVIKAVGKSTQLIIEENTMNDRKILDASLASKSVIKISVSGREAYLVPLVDMAGGTGLLLVGDKTALLLQDAVSADWPKTLEPEILSYIATVRVP
jgi:hypothetical protein